MGGAFHGERLNNQMVDHGKTRNQSLMDFHDDLMFFHEGFLATNHVFPLDRQLVFLPMFLVSPRDRE
jgi:hypothetical protein